MGVLALEGSAAPAVAVSAGLAGGADGGTADGEGRLAAPAAWRGERLDGDARFSRPSTPFVPRTMAGIAMNSGRETLLNRVRDAVREGNRAGQAPPLPERGGVGYQGGGSDPVARFCEMLTAAGGQAHRVADAESAAACVLGLVQAK